MSELARTEIKALIQKAGDLIREAQAIQSRLEQAYSAPAVQRERRVNGDRRKAPRKNSK
jgi:hypothetical protein